MGGDIVKMYKGGYSDRVVCMYEEDLESTNA